MIDGHPNTYIVPTGKTLAIGEPFGTEQDWRIAYRCKVSGNPTQWGIAQRKVPAVSSTGIISNWSATDNFPVLTTPQLEAYGLGFAGWYFHENEWPPGAALTNNDGPVPFWKNLPVADADGHVELAIIIVSRFVKINDNLDAILGGNPVPVQALPLVLFALTIRDNESTTFAPTAQVIIMPTLTIAQRACTPFTNTVHMPPITPDELPNIGSIGPEKEFFIEMRCPTNFGYMGYYVVPVHGIENEAQGVIKINPNSSAKGIGLRITTRSIPQAVYIDNSVPGPTSTYHPIQFGAGNRYRVYSYYRWGTGVNGNPLTDESNYKAPDPAIALKVAVYRTGNVIPGTYNAAIFIHLVYR